MMRLSGDVAIGDGGSGVLPNGGSVAERAEWAAGALVSLRFRRIAAFIRVGAIVRGF
jgi:hypothetical protein